MSTRNLSVIFFISLFAWIFAMNGCGEFQSAQDSIGLGSGLNSDMFPKVQAVINQNCVGCHKAGGSATSFEFSHAGQYVEAGLVSPGKPHRSSLISRLQNFTEGSGSNNTMPLGGGPLSEEDYQVLYGWVVNMPSGSSPFECLSGDIQPEDLPGKNAKRLSARQYENTLIDLLSLGINSQAAIGLVDATLNANPVPSDMSDQFDRENNVFNGQHGSAYFSIAHELAEELSSTHYNSLIANFINLNPGACSNPNPNNLSQVCKNQWVRNFVSRAFRRPIREGALNLTDSSGAAIDELAQYYSEFNNGSDTEAVNKIVFRVFMAPHFLFQIEDQDLVAPTNMGQNIHQLTSFAVASRLSYRFWNTLPDNTLWEMAESTNLYEDGAFNAAVNYVLSQEDKLSDSMAEFFNNWLHLEGMPTFNVNPRFNLVAPNIQFNTSLRRAMINDVEELGAYTVSSRGSFEDLFTSNVSFARNQNLMNVYGVSRAAPMQVTESNAVRFPAGERGGILTRGPFLVSGSEFTNPILRGAHLRKDILCMDLGSPPADALDQFNAVETPHILSTREKVGIKTSGAACVGCHNLINPLGFGFSNYDAFGRFIDQEPIFNETQNSVDAYVDVNSQVDLSDVLGAGAEAANAIELSQQLSENTAVRACFAKKFMHYAYNRPVDTQTDGCRLDRIYNNLDNEGRLIDMVRAAILGPEFRLRKIEE